MVKLKKEILNGEIPIFFSTDDNYVPFLDVTIRSIIANASKDYQYKIIVLNTGLNEENVAKVESLENDNFSIEFADISDHVKDIEHKLPNEQHFGLATWYRLFIQSLFPQYEKVLYLDCDLIVLGDVSDSDVDIKVENDIDNEYVIYHVYTLKEDDVLGNVISNYNVSLEKVKEYNDLDNIKTGDKIIIPEYGDE